MNTLSKKKIAIIGGSAGMGLSLAKSAAKLGADIIIGGRNPERLNAALAEIGENSAGFPVDTSDESSVKEFFENCGDIDHLATPGSSVRTDSFRQTTLEDLQYSIRNKFIGQALCAKHAKLAQDGSIVFFSGILAQRPGTSSLLGAINAAVECLAKGLAAELSPIRVNVVSPGMTAGTEAYSAMSEDARNAMFESFKQKLPTGSVGLPSDMADSAIFLMTSPFITGHILNVDGGGLLV